MENNRVDRGCVGESGIVRGGSERATERETAEREAEVEIDAPGYERGMATSAKGGRAETFDTTTSAHSRWSDISVLVSLLICMSSSLSRPSPLLVLVLSALSRRRVDPFFLSLPPPSSLYPYSLPTMKSA